MAFTPPDHVRRIQPYVPGRAVEAVARELGLARIVKLASNENPLGPSPRALEAAAAALSEVHRYPEGTGFDLVAALAARLGVEPQQIVLGNGSNELLDLVARTYYRPGDTALTSENSFVVYRLAMEVLGSTCRTVPMRDHTYDLEALAAAVEPSTRFLFVANPNNPTGTAVTATALRRLLDRLPESCLCCLDEAYFEYRDPEADPVDGIALLQEGYPIAVFRTFSKTYGLAGLRLGYCVGPRWLAEDLNRTREPFNTNRIAQAAALAALADEAHVARVVELNRRERDRLADGLRRLGLAPPPSQANFLYAELPRPASEVAEAMLRRGVIVRPVGPRAIRITVGLPEENDLCLEALAAAVEPSTRFLFVANPNNPTGTA
ncbi:MAG: histidinol-phosphate transaminase, partial [Nitrospirae bacterium]